MCDFCNSPSEELHEIEIYLACTDCYTAFHCYCPFCQKTLVTSNLDELFTGEHVDCVFVHDNVEHDCNHYTIN